jgi:tight adherence protein B
LAAAAIWLLAETVQGRTHRLFRPRRALQVRNKRQIWLSQAGAAVTSGQFSAVSAGVGLVIGLIVLVVTRTPILGLIGLVAGGVVPYSYWSTRRRQLTAARALAWPDALRFVIGALASGTSTLHGALLDLAEAGPEPLRAPIARYARRAAQIGSLGALEAVRHELADPVSDQVLLTLEQAVTEGTETVLRTLQVLLEQTTSDIALQDKIRTAGTNLRVASWLGLMAPMFALVLFCTVSPQYRAFFSTATGVVIVLLGAAVDFMGLMMSRRLARSVATVQRVFTERAV